MALSRATKIHALVTPRTDLCLQNVLHDHQSLLAPDTDSCLLEISCIQDWLDLVVPLGLPET